MFALASLLSSTLLAVPVAPGSSDYTFDVQSHSAAADSGYNGDDEGVAVVAAGGTARYELYVDRAPNDFRRLRVTRWSSQNHLEWSTNITVDSDEHIDTIPAVHVDQNGDLIFLAFVEDLSDRGTVTLYKVSSSGDVVFSRSQWQANTSAWGDIETLPNGDIVFFATSTDRPHLKRTNSNGLGGWDKMIGEAQNREYGSRVEVGPDGEIYIATVRSSDKKLFVYRFDGTGNEVWKRQRDLATLFNAKSGNGTGISDLELDPHGRVVVTSWVHTDGVDFVPVMAWTRDGKQRGGHTLTTPADGNSTHALVAYGPDGSKYVAYTTKKDEEAKLVKLRLGNGAAKRRTRARGSAGRMGQRKATASVDEAVVWEVPVKIGRLRKLVRTPEGGLVVFGGDDEVQAVAFSPTGKRIDTEVVPSPARPNPEIAELADVAVTKDGVYAVGRGAPKENGYVDNVLRIRYRYAKKQTKKAVSTGGLGSASPK